MILKHEGSKKYRGFAFVTYTEYKSTENLFQVGRFHVVQGKTVDCKYAFPKKDQTESFCDTNMSFQNEVSPQIIN